MNADKANSDKENSDKAKADVIKADNEVIDLIISDMNHWTNVAIDALRSSGINVQKTNTLIEAMNDRKRYLIEGILKHKK